MQPVAPRLGGLLRRPSVLCFAFLIITLVASDASAQYGWNRGGFGRGNFGRGYYGRAYSRVYRPPVYNQGYVGGNFGPRFYSRGYGGVYGAPYARPFVAPRVYGGQGFRGGMPY